MLILLADLSLLYKSKIASREEYKLRTLAGLSSIHEIVAQHLPVYELVAQHVACIAAVVNTDYLWFNQQLANTQ